MQSVDVSRNPPPYAEYGEVDASAAKQTEGSSFSFAPSVIRRLDGGVCHLPICDGEENTAPFRFSPPVRSDKACGHVTSGPFHTNYGPGAGLIPVPGKTRYALV